MALPVSSSPLPPDVAVHGWAAISVSVAWTLLAMRVRPRAEVLRDARDHALYHIPRHTSVARAEDLAAHYTRLFVRQARQDSADDPWPQDIAMPMSPRWRRAVDDTARPLTAAVFRHHYGYNRALESLEGKLQVDRVALEGARGGLREIVRGVARDDGVSLDSWPKERLDRFLRRLAAFSIYDSPPLVEVAEGCHQEWIARCPRCDRTARLARAGVLTSEDLIPALLGARPSGRVRVLAVHLHPDAKCHLGALIKEVGGHVMVRSDDLALFDVTNDEGALAMLRLAAEVESPHRDHMRAVIVDGLGRWSKHGLLGELAGTACMRVLSQSWGVTDGLDHLPVPLPPPVSPRSWWMTVAALSVAALAAIWFAVAPTPVVDATALDVDFTRGRGGIWVQFDTAQHARLTLVQQDEGRLEVLLSPEDLESRHAYATGDGSYRLHTLADGVLLASSGDDLSGFQDLVVAAQGGADPLADLAQSLRSHRAGAVVRVFR
ncbi:MAG: hypothetical protein ACI9MC_000792 [Kiritimatiellia bacterium]|jgi:hypothetical protein